MNISRNHAQIVYNFERGALRAHCSCVLRLPTVVQAVFGDTGSWEMVVMGKNGVTVQGTLYAPVDGQPMSGIQLHSQDYIQIGDRGFYFLLPRSQARHAQSVGALASGGLATGVSRRTELDFGVCRPGVAFGGWPAASNRGACPFTLTLWLSAMVTTLTAGATYTGRAKPGEPGAAGQTAWQSLLWKRGSPRLRRRTRQPLRARQARRRTRRHPAHRPPVPGSLPRMLRARTTLQMVS